MASKFQEFMKGFEEKTEETTTNNLCNSNLFINKDNSENLKSNDNSVVDSFQEKEEIEKPKKVLNLKLSISSQSSEVKDNNTSQSEICTKSEDQKEEIVKETKETILQDISQKQETQTAQIEEAKTENVNSNINENSDSNDESKKLEIMFKKSETNEFYREKWYEIYNKAINSDKKTQTNKKVREGKFRIVDGTIEILPDHETFNKTSRDLLSEQWNIGGK